MSCYMILSQHSSGVKKWGELFCVKKQQNMACNNFVCINDMIYVTRLILYCILTYFVSPTCFCSNIALFCITWPTYFVSAILLQNGAQNVDQICGRYKISWQYKNKLFYR